ncbi:MAG: hypothetical protein M3Y27_30325, partial [Acidobacteriota bacterium]|nr:hypothetical protein [Acidobacteriota bacterium]
EKWSREIQTELENLSGLVLIEGRFEVGHRGTLVLVQHFSSSPHRVDFVVEVPPTSTLNWRNGAKLNVFGVVTRPLDKDGEIVVAPIAIY